MTDIETKQAVIPKAADITDQQRREVAARLREGEGLYSVLMSAFDPDLIPEDVLAALIDRPTCRVLRQVGNPFGICSNCGKEVFADPDEPSRYCPECGAGVV